MVDYAKWDKFVADLSDEEDNISRQPKVTVLPENSKGKVTITKSGYEIQEEEHDEEELIPPVQEIKVSPYISNKCDIEWNDVEKNGRRFCWNQTESEVTICIPLNSSNDIKETIKGKDIAIQIIHKNLKIVDNKEKKIIFSGDFKYEVVLDDNISGEEKNYTDWEIKSDFQRVYHRVLELRLRKKSPIPGVIIWWKCIFEDDPEIDVTAIKARNQTRLSQTKSINDTFLEAQKQFFERMKQKQQIEVDVDSDEE